MVNILGLDPGGKTGVAYLTDDSQTFWEVAGGFDGFLNWWDTEGRLMPEYDNSYVIVEQFDLRNNDFVADITPKEIIGLLKYWSYLNGVELFWATPSAHKGLITNEALKRAGLYPPRGQVLGGHSTDGMRLACYHRIHHLRDREFSERLFPKNNN